MWAFPITVNNVCKKAKKNCEKLDGRLWLKTDRSCFLHEFHLSDNHGNFLGNWTLLVFGWGLESLSLRWWQYGRTFLSATTGVLFSQGLFRPCKRKPLPASYYTYFSIHRPLYFANKQWKDSRIRFVLFTVLSGDHVKTANTVTSNCCLIIFISPYSLKHNC